MEGNMARIIKKTNLNDATAKFVVRAPEIAKRAKPGQFVILRLDEKGERVPFTISETDDENVTIVVQIVGGTTKRMDKLEAGDGFLDFVGPLGNPTELDGYEGKNVCVIAGGLGTAIAYPQAKYLHQIGAHTDVIMGFRNKDLIIFEDELKENSDNFYIATDDGSYGHHGFVTDVLRKNLDEGKRYDLVLVIGPVIMMKNVADITKEYDIPTIASMNSIMVDGTGMCGCCRLTVGDEMKFACVDGPDFNAFEIDFEEAMNRSGNYKKQEEDHICRLTGDVRNGKI